MAISDSFKLWCFGLGMFGPVLCLAALSLVGSASLAEPVAVNVLRKALMGLISSILFVTFSSSFKERLVGLGLALCGTAIWIAEPTLGPTGGIIGPVILGGIILYWQVRLIWGPRRGEKEVWRESGADGAAVSAGPTPWQFFGYLLPRRIRTRVFEPEFYCLYEDYLVERGRSQSKWSRRLLFLLFGFQVARMTLQCPLSVLADSLSRALRALVTQTLPDLNNQVVTPFKIPLEKIAMRAYEKWIKRGRPPGTGMQDWIEAENELMAEMMRKR